MKRFTAWILVLLMLVQNNISFGASVGEETTDNLFYGEKQTEALAVGEKQSESLTGGEEQKESLTDGGEQTESPRRELSVQAPKTQYHTVVFTSDGEEVETLFVADGTSIETLPWAPEVVGAAFLGWYDGDRPFRKEELILTDRQLRAVYREARSELEEKKQNANFRYEDAGQYVNVEIFGTVKKNQVPSAVRNENLSGDWVISDAWAVSGIKNKTDLSLEAVVTALPAEGVLSAWSVSDNEVGDLLADNLRIGDTVAIDLAMKGPHGIAFVVEEEVPEEENAEIEGALYANEDLYITGKVPGKGIIDVQPVEVEIDGEKVIAAYDIRIYVNENQKRRGHTWEPAEKKVQVHLRDDRFGEGEYGVYHLADKSAVPEYLETVTAEKGWITFDAESFSIYAITEVKLTETVAASDGNTYEINVTYRNTSGIPMEGTALLVTELLPGDDSYDRYVVASARKIGTKVENIKFSRVFDIRIVDEADESHIYQPVGDVDVSIRIIGAGLNEYPNVDVLHFTETRRKSSFAIDELAPTVDGDGETVQFTTSSFSVYMVAGYVLETTIDIEGKTYKVKAAYDDYAGLPGDAKLEVAEILYGDEAFLTYLNDTAAALGVSAGEVGYLRLLDIAIVGRDGTKYQPNDQVKITVELMNENENGDLRVVHFGDEPEELDATTNGDTVTFETDRFSLFSFVDLTLVQNIVDAVFSSTYKDKIYENDDIIVSGKMPRTAIVEVKPVQVEIEDADVLVAYDIKIYAGVITRALGISWQPTDGALTVKVKSDAIDVVSADIYHMEKTGSPAELVAENIAVEGSTVIFEASDFSLYVVTETILSKTVEASDGNTYEISVTYQRASGIPIKGTELLVSEILSDDEGYEAFLAASADKVGTKTENIELARAFDIKIVDAADHSHVYEPTGDVDVLIRLVGASLNEYAEVDVLHFVGNEKTDGFTVYDMNSAIDGETVQFTTDSFSVYVIVGTTYLRTYRFFAFNEFGEYVEYALNTDSGKTTFTQTIKNGEKPVAPQNPTNPQDPNATFAGWFEDIRESGAAEPVFDESAYDFDNIPEITQNEEVHLYAKFSSYAYVIFRDQYDADTGTFPVAYTVRQELTDGSAAVNIAEYRVNYHGSGNGMVFTGWSEVPITTPGATNNDLDEAVEKLEDNLTVTGNKELYPIFTPVYWITFYSGYSGSGATYYPETYYLNGEGPTSLTDHIPARNVGDNGAYTFLGWYAGATLEGEKGKEEADITSAVPIANADGTLVSDFTDTKDLGISVQNGRIALTKDVTLYAAWTTTGEAEYSIIIWKQKATDASGLDDANKTYDFEERISLTGSIGTTVSVDSGYTERIYEGFEFKRNDSAKAIAADGSMVLNVYYDRDASSTTPTGAYVLTFADSLTGENASLSLPITYDQDSGDYAKIPYGTSLSGKVPDEPISRREGYSFTNWYADQDCTVRVFFAQDAYEGYTGTKVLYATMPDQTVTVYAGWEEIKYKVNIDPNYGALYAYDEGGNLVGTGATYFNGTHTSIIQEYTTVTRDYVESASGTWYYVSHDRAFYDAGNNVTGEDRYTYYTQNPGEATEFTTFAYEPGVYRYAGWYEVFNYGQADEYESDTPYRFGQPVDHDTTIRLHWTKAGAFYLVYDPGIGTLNDNEDQETFYVDLDGDTYADNADVVITRVATPPDGYEFTGWKIRGDESETIYYPGRSFTLLTQYAATVQGKKTVYLDAVYTKVPSASIVYHANGGVLTDPGSEQYRENFGGPKTISGTDLTAYTLVTTGSDQTVTVSNLMNNSQIILAAGEQFNRLNATFAGWYDKANYDGGTLMLAGSDVDANGDPYYVSADSCVDLFAVWQVSVKYHLNQSDANFGGDWGPEYTLNVAEDTYTQNICIGTVAERPTQTPAYTGSGNLTFRYWATKDDSDNYTMYDFSQPVRDALDLYAVWTAPLTVPVHAVDASVETLAEKTGSETGWTVNTPLSVSATSAAPIDLSSAAPAGSVEAPSDYDYAFAAIYSSTSALQNISESDAVDSIYYSSVDGKIHAVYRNGTDAALAVDDGLYFIYYKREKLNVLYRTMADNGLLTPVTVSSAPSETDYLGQYDMASGVNAPLTWLDDPTYTHYAFAIGSASASNAKDLILITSTSDTDSTLPTLLVKNTWRGFRYSTDGGMAWTSCSYAPTLYVVYFAKQATVVTFTENTVGLASDMSKEFTFHYKIETVNREDDAVIGTVYDTEPGNNPVELCNDEAYSVILFTDTGTTQQVTITQMAQTGFTTAVSADGATVANPYFYTAGKTGTAPNVTFTNTRNTVATVEVHVALVDVENGSIRVDDAKRNTDSSKYSFTLALDDQKEFEATLPPVDLFIGDSDSYAFGAVVYGTDSDGTVSIGGMNAVSIACELVETADTNVYGVYLKDGDGNRLAELNGYTLYYLYYPMPVLWYMEETDGGALAQIQGATDGSITYNGAALTFNGRTVVQEQSLEIPLTGLVISQSVGSGSFNMPPLLDKGTDKLYLVYSRIGVGVPGQTNISDISVSDDLVLYLQIRDNKLEWSFDGNTWTTFIGTPAIYAIYQERGYTLEITKTVPIDTGFTDPFTVTISSTAINRESYAVEGTGTSTVSAVRADGSTPGTITVQVTDGSVIRIFGLSSGDYTVTESGNENHILTATETYINEGNTVTSSPVVIDNRITIRLDREKALVLINTPKVICKVGTRYFHTIQSAVQWIEDNSATFSGTIEMLVDYLMPSSDAPVLPYYLDVTLTTASEYGSGTATITRSGNFASGAMFTNSGTLTLQNVILDGNGNSVTAASAMIDNEGSLTVSDGATLQNAKSSGNGGVINTWDGSVIVNGGSARDNTAENGGAIYASGGTVTISDGMISGNSAQSGGAVYYTGTGSVTVSGGSVTGNSAENGGAVYLGKGSLAVSGGSMGSNTASENGGAVYAVNGEIEITGGSLGGSETGNSAKNGGAVYLESGSVTVSENADISYNEVSENGGGICTGTGTVTMSGGSLASNTATGNGGGVYTVSGAITISGSSTAISSNAAASGGGLYSVSSAISVTNANLNNNKATTGSGGGVYAETGSVSLTSAKFTGNSATNGYGGGVYGDSGAMTLTDCTFGGASDSGNLAINGAAVYTNTGLATFSAGNVTNNMATNGGAVGVGSGSARLYFSGNVKITGNTMSGSDSNVYLDQDSDAVINAGVGNTGLGGNAFIGIYVPDKNVTVTDMTGTTSTANLFDRRGIPGAFFATYTSDSYIVKFFNDRLYGLSVQKETTSKRLYWGKAFNVEVRYLASFSGSLTTVAAGDIRKVDNSNTISYYAPSGSNTASEIADDLRSTHTINNLNGTAVFAVAFVGDDRTFENYITDVNWNSSENRWDFVKRDGTAITGDKLVIYFSEPAYIQIENNTEHPLDIPALSVLNHSAINSNEETGYGYVFAVNGVLQNELRPITAADLTLQPGKNIKLLFPGGRNAAWTLNGRFADASADIPYTLNGTANTLASANTGNFLLNGTTLNTNGGTYSIIFGGKSAICKIVTAEISEVSDSEIAGKTDPDSESKVEYTFSTLNQAVSFAKNHGLTDANVEMLVDYLIPASDLVSLAAGYNFVFTTATSGTYKYSDDPRARATISRDQGNNGSFITTETGSLVSGKYTSKLTLKNLIFDGKDFGGTEIYGGVIKTKGWNVEINKCDFRNCQARYGGGIFIESVWPKTGDQTPYGYLTVSESNFTNCKSLEGKDKFGGGGIWTSMREMTLTGCNFNSCEGAATIGTEKNAQGGGVFHFVADIDANIETKSTITNCTFENCSANAGGSMECGAKIVHVTGCTFRNSTAKTKNSGAFNVWVYNSDKSNKDSYVYVENCRFENCYCVNSSSSTTGNGGAFRSTATHNTVTNCTFINTIGAKGGAINVTNSNAVDTTISSCSFNGCSAGQEGGAIYCVSKTLTIKDMTVIQHCTAENAGGGVYHANNNTNSSLTVNDTSIDTCSSTTKMGGGVYTTALTASFTNSTVQNCSTVAENQNGGGLYLAGRWTTISGTKIRNCTATGMGGGAYQNSGTKESFTVRDNSEISGNTSGGMGGGIYTNTKTFTLQDSSITDNQAAGSGGGICQEYDNKNGRMIVDHCSITGNTSGGMGGGTYTLAQMTIRNGTRITGNELDTNIVTDAAGVYLRNDRTLTVGGTSSDPNYSDDSTVKDNVALGNKPSNLRLSQGNSLTSDNSTNSIDVLCHLSGEFRVIDAYSKGTQFGSSEISSAASPIYTGGFSDIRHVFIADDDSLYGIIDRSVTSLQRIIWAGIPICKITDGNGRLLYVDTVHEYPAVFDKLDTADANDTSSVSAFSILRNEQPQLYYADGTLYTGSTYQVKMLVENYTAKNRINTNAINDRTIILTTAGSADSQYPYRGRSGTRCTVTRGTSMGNNNFITANVNLTLTNIVLDGGSENGVTADSNTRIIYSNKSDVTVTLGRNSALQNAATTGNGGGVLVNSGASLVIEGGAIRNCSASNGGAVYKDGAAGTMTMTGGSITRCTASGNGGGIYINKGPDATTTKADSFTMTGGSITRCTASNGGGVWINNKFRMSMTGGSIAQNIATTAGGGIAVGGSGTRLNFSGAPFVFSNTCHTSVASTKASNVQMDQGFSVSENNPGTIIHTMGLIRGATIGVYVPGEDHNDNDGGSLYDAHGAEVDPFATYEGTPAGFNYFINDRNGLKGGQKELQPDADMKVYWRQIYTLEVNLEVLSRADSDKEKDFHFTVTLNGNAGGTEQGTQWNEVNDTYGDLEFHAGVATFTLNGSTKTTMMADLLPLGFGYTVTMDEADAAGFTVYPGYTQTGAMNNSSQFLYTVNFRVIRDVICKITDETDGLLYYKRGEVYTEAVYDALVSAFNRVNMGELYYKVGDSYIPYTANDHRIEMLIPDYEMTEATALSTGKNVLLTTADPNADDGFPYVGGSSTAVIRRGYDGASMITVNGNLTAGNITLDGNSSNYSISANGGIVKVASSASLTVGTGAALQNSKTSGSGAGVYLAEGATMNISGAPVFGNNISTGVTLGENAKNGDEPYTQAQQDIYIAGYNGTIATSLHVTGDLTGQEGSVWVWASEDPHYLQSQQFAVMDGGIHSGLNVFRNARTDEDTNNPLNSEPKYLYGVSRNNDGKVYWSGGANLTVIKTVTGDMGDITKQFTFMISGLTSGDKYKYTPYTSADGSTYTVGTAGTLTVEEGKITFQLAHYNKIVIEALPLNTEMTVSELNGDYTTTWQRDSNTATVTTGSTTSVRLTADTTLNVTNDLPAVAPTDVRNIWRPFLLMLVAGIVLLLISRKRKNSAEEA